MYTSARMLREQLIQVQKQRDTLLDMVDSLRRYIVDLEASMVKLQHPRCPCCTEDAPSCASPDADDEPPRPWWGGGR